MKTAALRFVIVVVLAASLAAGPGCGRKTNPLIPDSPRPEVISAVSVTTRGNQAFLSWPLPSRNVEGKLMAPADIDLFRIYRAEIGPESRTARYRPYTDIAAKDPAPATIRDNTVFWSDRDLKYGQTYGYQIRAISSRGGISGWSPEFRVKPLLPLAVPAGLTANGLDGFVQLKWNPVTTRLDGTPATGFIGYNVYRGVDAARIEPRPLNRNPLMSPSFKDTTAVNGQTYYYFVRSVDEMAPGNESPDSAQVSATPRDLTPPARPGGLSAVPGVNRVFLSWNENKEPDLAGYLVYRSLKSGGPYERLTDKLLTRTTFLDDHVVTGTTYHYVVTAVDKSSNESQRSHEQTVVVEQLLTAPRERHPE